MLQPSLSNGIKFGKINAGTAKNKKILLVWTVNIMEFAENDLKLNFKRKYILNAIKYKNNLKV